MASASESKTSGPEGAKAEVAAISPPDRYGPYKAEMAADLTACMDSLSCQPILFIGSGISRRYFHAPSWEELLAHLADICPTIDKPLTYYRQLLSTSPAIGQAFAERYQEWAWSTGKAEFPAELFAEGATKGSYIKHVIAKHLDGLTPASLTDIKDPVLSAELAALQAIRPHAIITTNYDRFLELGPVRI